MRKKLTDPALLRHCWHEEGVDCFLQFHILGIHTDEVEYALGEEIADAYFAHQSTEYFKGLDNE
jgi:hypothetical protein